MSTQRTKDRMHLNAVRHRAKALGIVFELDKDDIAVPTHCPVLGIPLLPWGQSGGRGSSDSSPSLDRIDPDLGYTKDNTRVISMRANRIKAHGSADELRKILSYIESNQ